MNENNAAAQSQSVSWQARWIWVAGPLQKPFHVAYFRTTFRIAKAVRASIHCAADSKYRLWVNGQYVGFGPARGRREHPYYDTHYVDLKPGLNSVAFLVQHYTTGGELFAPVQGGLICQVQAGAEVIAATGPTWKARSSEAYSGAGGRLHAEIYDARLDEQDWQAPSFDDRRWPAAKEPRESKLAQPDALLPRPIPLLTDQRIAPVMTVGLGFASPTEGQDWAKETNIPASLWACKLEPRESLPSTPPLAHHQPWSSEPFTINLKPHQAIYLNLDFGRNLLAVPEIDVQGPAGVIIDFGYAECLKNNRVAMQWQSPGASQAERIILAGGRIGHRMNQPRGMRYMMVRVFNPSRQPARVTIHDLCVNLTIFPARRRGQFRCSDKLLDRIYDMSAWTVNLCMEDAFTDCPWRERQQWLGDLQPEALFNYYCFGAYDLARKAVREFSGGNEPDGWLPGVFPVGKPFLLATWSMRFPVVVSEYYLYTGDASVLPDAYASVVKQMAWLAKFADADGTLSNVAGWNFVDWTKLDTSNNDGAVQGWYLEALDHSAKIALASGDAKGAAQFARQAQRLRKALAKKYWSPRRKAFLKYRPDSPLRPADASPDLIGQHENFQFTFLKVGSAAQRTQAMRAIAGATGRFLPSLGGYQSEYPNEATEGNYSNQDVITLGTPFWSYYGLLALMETGHVPEAIEYIRLCWGIMIENGATSCWEMWDRHTSYCHGWSAAPAMILPAYVLGVRPQAPGFAKFIISPRPGHLTSASGTVPTPHGAIRIAWRRDKQGGVACQISVPRGTVGRFDPSSLMPKNTISAVEIDGESRPAGKAIILQAGKHRVSMSCK